jgi:hypothetical protein
MKNNMTRTFQAARPCCLEIEGLIVRADFEALRAHEEDRLLKHLPACPACREFRKTMIAIRSAMSNVAAEALPPDPAVRSYLIREMKNRHSRRERPSLPLGRRMLALLKHRVPLYQAVLATALLILILPAVHTMLASMLAGKARPSGAIQSVRTESDSIAYANRLDSVDSLGMSRNSNGDSLVMK